MLHDDDDDDGDDGGDDGDDDLKRKVINHLKIVCFLGVTTHCGCVFHGPFFRGFLITHNDAP
jgi:hypothetical protein